MSRDTVLVQVTIRNATLTHGALVLSGASSVKIKKKKNFLKGFVKFNKKYVSSI